MKKVFVCLLLIILSVIIACEKKVDIEKTKSEVKQTIDAFHQAYFNKNFETFSKFFAIDRDILFLGTSNNEYLVGRENVLNSYKESINTIEFTNVDIQKESIHVHSSGNIAWITRIDNVKAKSGDMTFDLNGLRWTAILEKINGEWVFVHSHTSLPTPEGS